ncbi:MAG: nuclear transport factor 2 family protein [Flavobacteriaceae bacterium]|nr:nuclear transport factor 2 family protein [Flavobacteriaceae bacterium]
MKFKILLVVMLFTVLGFSQTDEEYKVKYAIETFFDGFHQSDSIKMKSVMHPNMTLQSIQPNKEGKEAIVNQNISGFLKLVSQYSKVRNWEEELQSFDFKIDGNLAQVWCPYLFYLNGMLSHCGANSIQLFYENEQWKIVSILDTRRKNCGE